MRKLGLLLLLAGIAFPAFAAKRVTVEQLEQVLAAAHGKPDAEVARQLSDFELTERLSAARLSRWESDLPGTETRQALIALADMSAFLDLPAAEIPAIATPDIPAQRQLMALTVDYVGKTISKLPNFFATRVTTRFEDTPRGYEKGQTVCNLYQPLHLVGRSSANVLYRDGQEVVDTGAAKGKKSRSATQGLTTSGEFGPILATVLVDAAQGKLSLEPLGARLDRASGRLPIRRAPEESRTTRSSSAASQGITGVVFFSNFPAITGRSLSIRRMERFFA